MSTGIAISQAMMFVFALGTLAADSVPDKIKIEKTDGDWRITGNVLEAVVAPDGCLTRLRFPFTGELWTHVPNYIKTGTGEAGAGGSRGCYFYQGGILRLTDIKLDGENALVAQNNEAMAHYEFSPESMKWKLTNKTDRAMQFLMVLDPTVQAVANDKGEMKKAPAIELWPDIMLYQGKRRLKVTGLSRIWGPGEVIGHDWRQSCFQVLEVTLNPKETRILTLTPGIATNDELNIVKDIAPDVQNRGSRPTQMIAPVPAVVGALTVFSPRDYQVFQRRTRLDGKIFFSGRILAACDKVEFRLSGKPLEGKLNEEWRMLPFNKQLNSFQGEVDVPAGGWYRAELRAMLAGKQVASAVVERVGVGEVFIGCGQSNSTNCGAEPTKTATGMVANFNGVEWRLADDPQAGTHDAYRLGSFWPSFGDAMFSKYGVPIGVAVTGHGGAPVSNWTPGSPAFLWLATRMMALGKGGFRAVLWHQGESNVNGTSEDYYQKLSTTIKATHAVAGWYFPWFVAQVSYTSPKTPSFASTRDAQKRLWDEGIALEGPDTDTLVGDYRAGVHFSVKGLKRHGEVWTDKVGVYLDKVLAE